jgi:hypothetical protein
MFHTKNLDLQTHSRTRVQHHHLSYCKQPIVKVFKIIASLVYSHKRTEKYLFILLILRKRRSYTHLIKDYV